jgi:MoxR-like ATPase
VFDSGKVLELATRHRDTLRALQQVESALAERFDGLEDAILALILAVASGEPLLLVGPPGTAKSKLIKTFCSLVGVDRAHPDHRYFEYLLTPFTEPGELFGFYDPSKLTRDGKLERINEQSMMQNAEIVFLDEVFKGSSAILNSLLSFMNERIFYDRGQPNAVPLQCLFGATNELPDSSELHAVWDRFALRCRVDNAAATGASIEAMLRKAWPLTYGAEIEGPVVPDLLHGLRALRADISALASVFAPAQSVLPVLAQLVQLARSHGLSQVSNRRLVKFTYVMLIHRVYDVVRSDQPYVDGSAIRPEELNLLPRYFLDDDTREDGVRQLYAAIEDWYQHPVEVS